MSSLKPLKAGCPESGGAMPVSVDSLIATTAATFAVARSVQTRQPEQIGAWASWDQSEAESDDESLSEAGAAR